MRGLLLVCILTGLIRTTVRAGEVLPLVFAQDVPAPNVSLNRTYWVEIAIVVILFGAALFAVCRSSGRR